MPFGKHKSKENTWTEKDLTEALQGEKPRHSKDEGRHRDSKEERSHKRHSKERGHEEREKGPQRSKHERSERHREAASLDPEEGSSRRTSRSKDDHGNERKHRDRTRDKSKDDEYSGRNERTRERQRGEKHKEHDKEERMKDKAKEEPSRREKEESFSGKERNRKSREGHGDERKRSREIRDREKEEKRRGIDKEEKWKDMEKGERKRDMERERKRDKEKDEKQKHREKRQIESTADQTGGDRKKDREKGRRNREEMDEEDYEKERERRRRRREEKERREKEKSKIETEKSKIETENESRDKEKRRKEKRDKEGLEEDQTDKHRRREDREKRRQRDYYEDSGQKDDQRRHKERQETEYKDSNRRKSKEKLEVNGTSSPIMDEAEVDEEIVKEDNYDEDNYEDDFEDYDDDFEDVEDDDDENIESEQEKGKLLEIFEAINAENDDVRTSSLQPTTVEELREEEEKTIDKPVKSSSRGRINFLAAKQKHVNEFVASKTKKRAQELDRLIELDVASYDIFDLPPLNEYELYIKSYGQSDSKQAYVQCHDNIVEKEMQTEEIETSTKWTQNPPDDFKGWGEGEESVNNDTLSESAFSPRFVDSIKLINFLQKAGQVCLILLEEDSSGKTDFMFKDRNDIDISNGFIQLTTKLPFLEGRRVLDMSFNSIQTHLLLTAHDSGSTSSTTDANGCLHGKGLVCFWNVNEPTQPQKILYCESSPRSCCFSPVKSSLVFAGLDDGSIVIWDLRELSTLHSIIEYMERKWVVRRPTFSTAGVLYNENHHSPVQSIIPISLPKESGETSMRTSLVQDDHGGMAFQLASLEENGFVNIWVVIELDKPDEAGSESDFGLAPGGRVKLIKSTSIQVESPDREIFSGSSVQASVMQFSSKDSNNFYVGTDRGWVIHCTRYGGKPRPKVYRPEIDCLVAVTDIDVSPWSIPVMLVGCGNGTLRLHDLRKEHAIRSWPESTQGSPIVRVRWSRSRPSLFYVLDTKSHLYIWDLLQKDGCPVAIEHFKRRKLLFFSISNDYESLGIGLRGRKSELVLNYEGGIIELHRLKDALNHVQADELDRFASLVDSFM